MSRHSSELGLELREPGRIVEDERDVVERLDVGVDEDLRVVAVGPLLIPC